MIVSATSAIVSTTLEQQQACKKAAVANYRDKLGCPDRPGWTGGKCPKTEYRSKLTECGAANYMQHDWHNLCLFSTNPADYTKPDIADWDIKAGNTFNRKDIAKGTKYILWVTAIEMDTIYYCGYKTCKTRIHHHLTGDVKIIGWTDLASDVALCLDKGRYYKVTPAAIRPLDTMPKLVAA